MRHGVIFTKICHLLLNKWMQIIFKAVCMNTERNVNFLLIKLRSSKRNLIQLLTMKIGSMKRFRYLREKSSKCGKRMNKLNLK